MTDTEILDYLEKNNWELLSHDYIRNIANTSPQIIKELYDFDKKEMTIVTPENTFTFEWKLQVLN